MLKPVLRYCLRNRIGIRTLFELTKAASIAVSVEELESSEQAVTVSSISVMTGLNRREVTRIHREKESKEDDPYLPSRILTKWEQIEKFRTKSGKPRVLTWQGEDSEFYELCRSVSQDLRPAAVLAELERAGLVTREKNRVKMLHADEGLSRIPEKAMTVLLDDTEALIRNNEENVLLNIRPRHLHFRTDYDNLVVSKLSEIREWFRARGREFHKDVRSYLADFDKDLHPKLKGEGGGSISITSFSWTTKNDE